MHQKLSRTPSMISLCLTSLNENDYQVVIESMNDEQVDHILVRLKERSLL